MDVLVLFDVDGTLVLTGGAGVRAMDRAFREAFQIADAFGGISMAGRTDLAIIDDALVRTSLTPSAEELQRFRACYRACLVEEIRQPGPRKGVMPGVPALLDALTSRADVQLALLTGNFPEAAQIKLEYFQLWRYFDWGVFGDEARDRNDLVPIALARARSRGLTAVDPRRVLVVGDTPFDVACATAAGARAVAVATGGYDEVSLRAAGADVVLANFSDTAAFLRLIEQY